MEDIKAWLEKQKEQKQELPLMDGDTDAYFDDLRITTKPLTSREWFDEGIKYAQRLQQEQKPAEWVLPEDFEEAVYKVANFISPFDSQEELRKVSHRFAEQLLSLAKNELDKPAEWSEEDELKRSALLNYLYPETGGTKYSSYAQLTEWYNWLKSLRLKSHWKPSEEQMEALKMAIEGNCPSPTSYLSRRLEEIYEHLKKLMED